MHRETTMQLLALVLFIVTAFGVRSLLYRRVERALLMLSISLALFGLLLYLSPDEELRVSSSIDAIEAGRTFVYNFAISNKPKLRATTMEPARSKLENHLAFSVPYISSGEILKDPRYWGGRLGPLAGYLPESADGNFEVLAFTTHERFAVCTFGYRPSSESDWQFYEVGSKGRLLYSVALLYTSPEEDSWGQELIRKFGNLPLVRSIDPNLGTSRSWWIVDFTVPHSLQDYHDALRTPDPDDNILNWTPAQRERFFGDLDKQLTASWRFYLEWMNREMSQQIRDLEQVHYSEPNWGQKGDGAKAGVDH